MTSSDKIERAFELGAEGIFIIVAALAILFAWPFMLVGWVAYRLGFVE